MEVESRQRNPTRCCWERRFWHATGVAFAQTSMIEVDDDGQLPLIIPIASAGCLIISAELEMGILIIRTNKKEISVGKTAFVCFVVLLLKDEPSTLSF